MDVADRIGALIGRRKVMRPSVSSAYSRDESYLPGVRPLAVVFPASPKDVSAVARVCNASNTVIVARGGGSSLTGASIPVRNSVVLDMSRMARILETHIEDEYVVVEPGATLDSLNRHLSGYGYFYPPDPASSAFATVGGTISTNAGGLRAIMYGSTKEWVLGLEVVLANGSIIRTGGRTTKRSIGYDLTAIMVGSEGTLGIITKAVLKIWPKPEATGRIVSYYPTISSAASAVGAVKRKGIIPLSSEFMDATSLMLMRKYMGAEFPSGAKYSVLMDLAGGRKSMQHLLSSAEKALRKFGAESVTVSKSKKEMGTMLNARKHLFDATLKRAESEGKSVIIADIVVPLSILPTALYRMEKALRRSGIEAALFGHIGDGNVHANMIADPGTEKEILDRLQEEFGRIAISGGGSISGEHGIGIAKKHLLISELKSRDSEHSIRVMQGIKKAFDPNGIMNRGKIFDWPMHL